MTESVPRSREDDYTQEMAERRRGFVGEKTGVRLRHVGQFSFEPSTLPGNIENFIGVAQVPIGLAGPLRVNGEHACGDFYVPLATTEGTLVASYNRGMKLLRAAGGVQTTVHDDCMQRAPAFLFHSAREATEFGDWILENMDEIRRQAESTTHVGKLRNIEQYSASRFRFLRFDYTTGDAAGQNMVTKATRAACDWIKDNYAGIDHYYLESNFATDKKSSQINILRTRGKRVTAEAIVPANLLTQVTHAPASLVLRARQVANLGAMISGANNNGAHAANAITAIFIATGQDVANVSESCAGIIHAELTPEGDYYFSVTLPSLIVASYGGGTGLPTQRECLEIMGCYGEGKVRKLAEIVAATVLCGELSLGGAIVADEWVASHEHYGRSRR